MLTPDGEALARFARDRDDRFVRFLGELRGTPDHRPVVLAAGEGGYLYLLGDVIREAVAAQRIRLVNTDRARTVAAVRAGRAHLGVAVLDVLPDDLVAVPVRDFDQVLLLPDDHPLARRKRLKVRDLAGLALVVPPPERPHRIAIERALRGAGVAWSVAVEAEGWPLTAHFVGLGIGMAVVNGCVTPGPGVTARPIVDLPRITYYALHRPGARDDPRVDALLARIRAQARLTTMSP